MVKITISPGAFAAIVASLPGNASVENKRAPYFVWLDHATLAKPNHLRGPGESYSDVILALADR
jgi:hypothetical protein